MGDARAFVEEAYKHAKTIGASGEGADLIAASQLGQLLGLKVGAKPSQARAGVVLDSAASSQPGFKAFLEAVAQHRHWGRDLAVQVSV
jgi:catalase